MVILGIVLAVGVVSSVLIAVVPRVEAAQIRDLGTSTTGTIVDCDRASAGRRAFGGRYRAVWEYEVDGATYRYRDTINRMQSSECDALLTGAATATIFYDPADPDRAARGDILT